ncbi:hypothetical protein [Shewanella sp. 10N.286.52.B9]|uniref:hypothetical protein n=1 Tax=Shewanella sp. 10N.286.52.B9 TaxID=1880837 RepID=UPI000C84FCAF|nr:hypothetical protein [Shewanella sp. 10N.286.52.B9]PMG43941.1 hypothetical protein BCU91_19895 [Shewanella sp. 10N.286.52.B9]
MVKAIIVLLITLLFLMCGAASANDLENDPLAKRCINLFEIYKNNDLSAYVNGFPDEVVAILGEDFLKTELNNKHNKFEKNYNSAPKEIRIKSIENIQPHPTAVERIGVEESRKVFISVKGVNSGLQGSCSFNRIKTKWYFRDTPL